MAKVILFGLESAAAHQIERVLQNENHWVLSKSLDASDAEILDADIVFATGDGKQYVSLLKRVRETNPALPFVVVTRLPETSDWLDALEAGATDYCSAPFEPHQLRWLMESALPRTCPAAA
jgi:DNA-binding response OmpR family regulator